MSKLQGNDTNQGDFLEALHDVGKMVNSTLDIQTILDRIVSTIPRIMGVQAVTVRLLDETEGRLNLVASKGLSEKYLCRGSVESEEAIQLALQGKTVVIENAAKDPRIKFQKEAKEEGIAAILAAPIMASDEVMGVLWLLSPSTRRFSNEEVRFVSTLAEHCGIAIRNAIHYEKMNRLLHTIEQERTFLEQVVDSLDLELLAIDLNRKIILVNKKFAENRKVDRKSIIGATCDSIQAPDLTPETAHCASCPLNEALRTKTPINFAARRESLTGVTYFYDVVIAPMLGPDGQVEHVIEIIRDVTHEWLNQRRVLEAEKMKGVLETSAAVSHELNSPIFAVLGTAQLMSRGLKENESLLEDVNLIIRNMKKISALTTKISRISKYQTRDYVGDERLLDIHGSESD